MRGARPLSPPSLFALAALAATLPSPAKTPATEFGAITILGVSGPVDFDALDDLIRDLSGGGLAEALVGLTRSGLPLPSQDAGAKLGGSRAACASPRPHSEALLRGTMRTPAQAPSQPHRTAGGC